MLKNNKKCTKLIKFIPLLSKLLLKPKRRCDIIKVQEKEVNVKLKDEKREGSKIMCKASEVGKIVINKCLRRGLNIDAQKLQKLLVLMQVECIKNSGKPLFKEDIRIWDCGVAIKEVDEEFRGIGNILEKQPEQIEYINLLEKEEKSVNRILDLYGDMDAMELNSLSVVQKIISLAKEINESQTPHISYQILMGAFWEE